MRKPITVVLELGPEWIIAEADDWPEALAVANNMLSMRKELPAKWRLRIEQEGPGLKVIGPKAN
jgi:hypothetical protein